jgi:hypothetical protein
MAFFEEENRNDFQVNNFSAGAPSIDSGQGQFPQFDTAAKSFGDIQQQIESAKSNGWGAQLAGFLSRNKKRLLVLSAIILMFAGGSYLSDNNNTENAPGLGGTASIAENTESDNNSEKQVLVAEDLESQYPVNILDIKLSDDGQVMLSQEEMEELSLNDGAVITKTASAGDGITHLARQALEEYLRDSEKTLSAEQKVYAEDYVQNKTGSELLEIGQSLSFSENLLGEAVDAAELLTDWQIENLKQYTS